MSCWWFPFRSLGAVSFPFYMGCCWLREDTEPKSYGQNENSTTRTEIGIITGYDEEEIDLSSNLSEWDIQHWQNCSSSLASRYDCMQDQKCFVLKLHTEKVHIFALNKVSSEYRKVSTNSKRHKQRQKFSISCQNNTRFGFQASRHEKCCWVDLIIEALYMVWSLTP